MQTLTDQIKDRNRMENGKDPRKKLCGHGLCINCSVISKEMKKLKDECERLFSENLRLKGER